jgi:cysteine desulfurase
MDHGATTPTDPRVVAAMEPYFNIKYGNPSSLHSTGQEVRASVEKSRETVAKFLGVSSEEIIFTASGTEGNNLALKGIAFANRKKGRHIITTSIEHHCVLDACKWLGENGFDVTYLPAGRDGIISAEDFENALRKDTIIASIMYANNEIGTIQPVDEIGKICREREIYLHTDAVQAYGKIPLDIKNADVLTTSGHKIYGPKGVGAMLIRRGTRIQPILHGGGQEFGMRSSTENTPGIVGFGKATEIADKEMKKDIKKQTAMRDRLIKKLLKIEDSRLNGHPTKRLPNNANFAFKFIEGESLILKLNDLGIAASTGSACSSKSLEPSHVLLAIGLKHEEAHGSLRLTLGRQNTIKDVNYAIKTIPKVVGELRTISPFKGNF